jgi:hypothetical protein
MYKQSYQSLSDKLYSQPDQELQIVPTHDKTSVFQKNNKTPLYPPKAIAVTLTEEAYRYRYPLHSSTQQPWQIFLYSQARRDSNPQPTVLETVALPIELLA